MTYEEENKFKEAVGFRQVERCCGTCWWFDRGYDDDAGCRHPRQAEFDAREKYGRMKNPDHIPPPYGAYGGARTDEGHVCNLWEKNINTERGEKQ